MIPKPFIISLSLVLILINQAKSQCLALANNYCLTNYPDGATITINTQSLGQYTRYGTRNGCPYFRHNINSNILFYDTTYINGWAIDYDFDASLLYAYCRSSTLDYCGSSSWYFYGTLNEVMSTKYKVYIEAGIYFILYLYYCDFFVYTIY